MPFISRPFISSHRQRPWPWKLIESPGELGGLEVLGWEAGVTPPTTGTMLWFYGCDSQQLPALS